MAYVSGNWDQNVDWWGGAQSYADQILAKKAAGQDLTDPTGAAAFQAANPGYFKTATPTTPEGKVDFDQYTSGALNQATSLMNKAPADYPNYVPSQTQAPNTYDFYNYTPTSPMASVTNPDYKMTAGNYQGLMSGGNTPQQYTPGSYDTAMNYFGSPEAYAAEIMAKRASGETLQQPDAAAAFQAANPGYFQQSDYDKLQQALTVPGRNAATYAYDTGLLNLTDIMGGRGLYGSSIMQNQQTQGLDKVYQQAVADNAAKAAATRYGMEQTDLNAMNQYNLSRESDLNKFNAQNYATGIDQNKNIWAANAAETANKGAYDTSKLAFTQSQDSLLRDWQNKSDYEKYTYGLAKNAYQNQSDEALMNRALATAGQGAPLSQMATNYQLAQQQNELARQAAASASSAQNTASWLGAGGTTLAGLLGGYGNSNSTSGIWDWLTG